MQTTSDTGDSHALRELADALTHERTVLRTMIDLIPAFIYAKDAQSRFTACNALVAQRLGTTPADMVGKTDFDFFPRAMAEKFFAEEQALIASGKPLIDLEEAAFDKERGENRVILTSKVPLKDENGNLTGIVGTGYDITERKALEQQLGAIDRHESIGRLAAGVAHEINTPIQYLSDSVQFIDEGVQELLDHLVKSDAAPKTSDAEEDLDYLRQELPMALKRVAEGLQRIAEVVRSMKEFARADLSEMGAIDINKSIQSTLVVARSQYRDVAEIATDFGDVPAVVCHGGQINNVILNLLVNAAHAIEDADRPGAKPGIITVRTCTEGDHVVISITDTGCGIREEIRTRIFDPFFTTKEVGRGRGQGLTMARNVVKGHGGELDFNTEFGKGTTFWINLPIRPAQGVR